MMIHIIKNGETMVELADRYGVDLANLLADNGMTPDQETVVGQAVVVQIPERVHRVSAGETLYEIARANQTTVERLYQNNYRLMGEERIRPGEELVLRYQDQGLGGTLATNSYAYPSINGALLRSQLPYLSYLTPFTYGIGSDGALVNLEDEGLLSQLRGYESRPLMHLSTLTEEGRFSNERASMIFRDAQKQEALIEEIVHVMQDKGYRGVDVDFEFIFPEERYDYIAFLQALRLRLNPLGYPIFSALAPKTDDMQMGMLYEGHDYAGIGAAVNGVLLMTYEWGYTYGPPMAVAPIENVRRVVEYAVTRISRDKIMMGIPTYGYDWILPYQSGNPGALSLSPIRAVELARRYRAEILFDTTAQSPWFRYTDEAGRLHEVWFEDARSIQAKLHLVGEFGLRGVGYWNAMRDFPQNWVVLNQEYRIDMHLRFS